ncbi:MAG: phosphoribosylformylglycinamidine synthase subunit PurS [Saprospiraceae bacterium]|nr:phosphoribosylformylglycinamidine synthase subunit PurS [Saprospiraceae bacterium]MBK6480196.1 phosphoribosylformylglycinamidine synthase subunit PurS [Saprospiraceae bacterium]MBK7435545.1 phosphoribosylformylglycinamidine synthase subunit PurS [Saprospiraceae bacterium]MBK7606201.1 phosphoribosylformylglycinamidine synthase subunit PurS [Saprospiraceae bacterium]MBK8282029.1 phosphoribosylformylglycinamidine synthase subunit PurS [Saprospiraceae bacterium]
MKFAAQIRVMPHKVLLDPQGKTVSNNLKHIGLEGLTNVRIGKNIQMEVEATDASTADSLVKSACEKLLTNPIMEYFEYSLTEVH